MVHIVNHKIRTWKEASHSSTYETRTGRRQPAQGHAPLPPPTHPIQSPSSLDCQNAPTPPPSPPPPPSSSKHPLQWQFSEGWSWSLNGSRKKDGTGLWKEAGHSSSHKTKHWEETSHSSVYKTKKWNFQVKARKDSSHSNNDKIGMWKLFAATMKYHTIKLEVFFQKLHARSSKFTHAKNNQ